MLPCCRSGLSPAPSTGTSAAASCANGSALKTIRPAKKAPSPSRTACATGTISRTRLRVRRSTRLAPRLIRSARPTVAMLSTTPSPLVLRRALRDQRVPLADVRRAGALPDRDDDPAALAEGVGHDPGVADGDRDPALGIPHAEEEHPALSV